MNAKIISNVNYIFQSLSDEDSFKKISTLDEVVKKTEELLTSLTER